MSQVPDYPDGEVVKVHAVEATITARQVIRSLPERQMAWDRLWRILLTPRPPGPASSAPDGMDPTPEQVAA